MSKILALIASLQLTSPAAALALNGGSPDPGAASAAGAPPARTRILVDCSNPRAPVHTIADGLRALGDARPAALLISGTCHENVTLSAVDRVALQGNPTATIDGSDPTLDTVLISDAWSIDLVDLTITGGGDGVACGECLARLTRVTVTGSPGPGVVSGTGAQLVIGDSFIRGNGDVGVFVGNGSTVRIGSTDVSGNAADGIFLNTGATLAAFSSTVVGNHGNGVTASLHDTVLLNTVTIAGNDGDGVSLQGGSSARTPRTTIAGNGGHQLRVGDLSFAQIPGAGTFISGSGGTFPDVVCDPAFSALRGLGNAQGSPSTNCPDEQPRAP